ncbi:MAG: hypothetical protein HFF68_01480 [Oscillospiraceae bacterium]|nr:hypothetical protein [Oscillospiraceae bacterium]
MTRGKAEDAGGLTPAKDDNAAPYHFDRRTLPIFKCVDYITPERKDRKEYMPCFAAAAAGCCEQNGLNQMYDSRILHAGIIPPEMFGRA